MSELSPCDDNPNQIFVKDFDTSELSPQCDDNPLDESSPVRLQLLLDLLVLASTHLLLMMIALMMIMMKVLLIIMMIVLMMMRKSMMMKH